MNALHPMPVAQGGTPSWPDAAGTLRLVRRLSGGYGAVLLLLGAVCATPLGAEARSTGLAGVALGAVLLAWAGLMGTLAVAWARARVGQPAPPPAPARGRWARLLPRRRVRLAGEERLARMARRPQGIIVPALCLAAVYAVWRLWPGAPGPLPHALLLGGGAVVLAFPLLVMERIVGSVPPARLPEAPALEALLFVPVAAIPLAGLLHVLAGAGMGWARLPMALAGISVCVAAAELARAAARSSASSSRYAAARNSRLTPLTVTPSNQTAPSARGGAGGGGELRGAAAATGPRSRRPRGADPHPSRPRLLPKLGAPLRADRGAADDGGPGPRRLGPDRRHAARP